MSSSPQVMLRLQLGSQLAPLIEGSGDIQADLIRALEVLFTGRLGTLGIPGTPEVDVAVDQTQQAPVRWFLHRSEIYYPEDLPAAAWAFVNGETPGSQVGKTGGLGWMDDLLSRVNSGQVRTERLVEFFCLFADAALEQRPSALLGEAQIQAYAEMLGDVGIGQIPAHIEQWLGPVLREVLDMGYSIGNTEQVIQSLRDGGAAQTPHDFAENLIADLARDTIDIHMRREFFKRFSLARVRGEICEPMIWRSGIFYRLDNKLGICYPPFRFVASETLPERGFEFRIQEWTSLPRIGLAPDELLVNDTAERLTLLNINGRPSINPADGSECSIISAVDYMTAWQANLKTWDEAGYVELCLAAELRRRSGRLVTVRSVDGNLVNLGRDYPNLVTRARDKFGIPKITRVLRRLVMEEISLRNLRGILERLLEFGYIHCDSEGLILFDDKMPINWNPNDIWTVDPDTLTDFVRAGLKRYISHQASQGSAEIEVLLLDPKIETLLTQHKARGTEVGETDRQRLIAALEKAVCRSASTRQPPVLVTKFEIRSLLRKLIETRFPRLRVLCYQELSPEVNVQVIAGVVFQSGTPGTEEDIQV